MAISSLAGVNYTLDGDTIDFFGAKGRSDGGSWLINAFGGDLWVQVAPDSIMHRVQGCIEADVENGHDDQIAQLQLGARQAVVFFLEGKLTRAHLRHATEGPDFVDIPDVEIEGRNLTVRVLEEPTYDVATADRQGHIL